MMVRTREPRQCHKTTPCTALAGSTAELCKQKQYDEALAGLATIRQPLDAFFDRVMVMVDDEGQRNARLGLLQRVASMFQSVADFSEVVTGTRAS